VLIRFAPLLEQSAPARWLLVVLGLGTAVLAGLVMLTRISIKVRLAWSTVAQMGFMVMECGLGLYTLAALHLVGHSLYKAHAFLSASAVVRQTRLQACGLRRPHSRPRSGWHRWWPSVWSRHCRARCCPGPGPGGGACAGPGLGALAVAAQGRHRPGARGARAGGLLMIAGLAAAALLAHAVPLGIHDAPYHAAGRGGPGRHGRAVPVPGIAAQPARRAGGVAALELRRLYVDEFYTRLTLWLWPTRWAPESTHATPTRALRWAAPEASH
jgi:NAD(P)H-quinone oxidoreductase subunit 5